MAHSSLVGLIILALALISSSAVDGQTNPGVHRIGVIYLSGHHQVVVDGLRQGLRDLGLQEGKHVALDIREIKDGDWKAVGEAARDLERTKVELIYTVTSQITLLVRDATRQVPIVFYAGVDPVALKLAESFAKPGGRLTGVHGLSRDLTVKRLEILKQILPKFRRVVTLYDASDELSTANARVAREVAQRMGLQFIERRVESIDVLRASLLKIRAGDAQAYLHTPGGLVTSQALLIIDAARTKRMATMFHDTSLVERGGLAAYGHSYFDIGRLSAKYVQRILSGIRPADLPIENYDKVGLAINLRTASEIGLTIPTAVQVRADQVIR